MLIATKFAILPNREQKEKLLCQFGAARWVYNKFLELKQSLWKTQKKDISTYDMVKLLPKWKEIHTWLQDIDSQALQQSILHLGNSFKNFFQKRSRFPKFKNKNGKQAISYPQRVKINGNKIYLPKIGWVKVVLHREVIGKIKTVTVSRSVTGKYYVSVLMKTEHTIPNPIKHLEKVTGIDVGLTNFLTDSKGNTIENPRFLKRATRNLRMKQKNLSRKCKGTKNRAKARVQVAKVHEKISNARNDFQHKTSKTLADENQAVGIEDLHIKGMQKNRKLAKSISDASWRGFLNKLKYKLLRQGKHLVQIGRYIASSKECSECNYKMEEMPLSIRKWSCPNCRTEHDRDHNAAKRILQEAILKLKADGHTVSACGGLRQTWLAKARQAVAYEAGSLVL